MSSLSQPSVDQALSRPVRRIAAVHTVLAAPVLAVAALASVASSTIEYGARRGLLTGIRADLDEREHQLRGQVDFKPRRRTQTGIYDHSAS